MAVCIIRQDKYGRGERWSLNIGDSVVTLAQPGGRPLLEWRPEQVADGVDFPSFSRSLKYVEFSVQSVGIIQFAADPATVKSLRAFANRGIAARGPEALRTVLRIAVLSCLFGAILLCVGASLFVFVTYQTVVRGSPSSGIDHVTFIIAISGFAILCRGIYGFYQYSQLRRLSAAETVKV